MLHTYQKEPLLFRICRQKCFAFGLTLLMMVTCTWVLDPPALPHCAASRLLPPARVWAPAWPICCSGWHRLISFHSLIWQHFPSPHYLAGIQYQCYWFFLTSLLYSFVPFCEDEEATNGKPVFWEPSAVLRDLGPVSPKRFPALTLASHFGSGRLPGVFFRV